MARPVRRLIDEGHVKGKNFVQFGLNSTKPGMKADLDWMRKNQIRFHFISEIERDGWPAVMKRGARRGTRRTGTHLHFDRH